MGDVARFTKKGQVATIALNQSVIANANYRPMAMQLADICQGINQDRDIRVVVIGGGGPRAFCLGENPNRFSTGVPGDSPPPSTPNDFPLYQDATVAIASIECPVIAAINGDASGGGLALALACDLRIAAEGAVFSVPDLNRGYLLPNGITQWLPRIVGRAKAMEMILTSQPVDAHEALRMGLVHRLVPANRLQLEAEKLAAQIASGAPVALRYAKEAVNKGMDLTLPQGLRLECDLYMILQTTQDRLQGITAFRDKRQPDFKGA